MFNNLKNKFSELLEPISSLKDGDIFHEFEFRFDFFNFKPDDYRIKKQEMFKRMLVFLKIGGNVIETNIEDRIYNDYMGKKTYQRITRNSNGKIIDKEYVEKITKTKITEDLLRMSYSVEKTLKKVEGDIKNVLYKHRFSKHYPGWVIDITNIKSLNKHIIEVELKDKKFKEEYFDFILGIYKSMFSEKDMLMGISPMNPHSLEQKDIIKLASNDYTVTDKADGERVFMTVMNNKTYFTNPKTKEVKLGEGHSIETQLMVFDGEYLEKTSSFYVFDMLFANGESIRDLDLDKRLELAKKYLDKKFSKQVKLFMKKFYFKDIYKKSKELWDNRKKLFDYELDGLIFTPIKQPYVSDLSLQTLPVFKWKELLSIDVRIEYNKNHNFTYFHHSSNSKYSRPWGNSKTIFFNRWGTKVPLLIKSNEKFTMVGFI